MVSSRVDIKWSYRINSKKLEDCYDISDSMVLPTNADLNDYKHGTYFATNSVSQTILNRPTYSGSQSFSVLCFAIAQDSCKQFFFTRFTGDIFVRSFSSSFGWTQWMSITG